MWYRVIRYSQAFCGLIGDQRTPGFWGVTVEESEELVVPKELFCTCCPQFPFTPTGGCTPGLD